MKQPKAPVECPLCDAIIKLPGLKRHQQTLLCETFAKDKIMLQSGWTRFASYSLYPGRNSLIGQRLNQILDFVPNKHLQNIQSGYRYAGWGHSARTYSRLYIRTSFQAIIMASCVTDDDIQLCMTLDEDNLQYQAFYVLAMLGSEARQQT